LYQEDTLPVAQYVNEPGQGAGLQEAERIERPRRYKVLLHNDHYTTMEFVVYILEEVFRKPHPEAVRIMLDVHENGMGLAGVYVKQIAETKVAKTHGLAKEHGYPLKCSMERE